MAESSFVVRREEPADLPEVRRVHVTAFGRSLEADIVDRLRERGDVVAALVAGAGDAVVGSVLFSPLSFAPTRLVKAGLVGPLAVSPSSQGRGVGSALVRGGLRLMRELDYGSVFVLGAPAYYGRFGFLLASRFGVSRPGWPEYAFQAMELQENALVGPSAVARESAAFAIEATG